VAVTVSGPGVLLETETLTSGAVGSFRVPDLPMPGTYTITFDLPGFARQTSQFTLSRAAPLATVDVRIGANLARIAGRITDGGATAEFGLPGRRRRAHRRRRVPARDGHGDRAGERRRELRVHRRPAGHLLDHRDPLVGAGRGAASP
jgi:hypothetical protein